MTTPAPAPVPPADAATAAHRAAASAVAAPAPPTVAALLSAVEVLAPRGLAESWDNVGLLVGRSDRPVRTVLLATDITEGVVREAASLAAGAVLAHHPVMLKGVQRLTDRDWEARTVLAAAEAGIALIAAHTNLDNTVGGTNDTIADLLGLTGLRPLVPVAGEERLKLAVFTPDRDLDRVRAAMCAAGAGRIGRYAECSFRTPGTGTFLGGEGSNPAVGKAGRLEEAPEQRLEVVLPARKLAAVVAAMRAAHSYEEPAFDVYPLRNAPGAEGSGRVGDLSAPESLSSVVWRLKRALDVPVVGVVGPRDRTVRRVAICTGSCGKLMNDARSAGADLYITGEMRHHDAVAAREEGLTVVTAGHFGSERVALFPLAKRLAAVLPGVEFKVSRTESEPFAFV